ncbi:MAG: class B sortase [Lachnospiraceae bacterium]|nr:class B sortase [Lachnospiraceae bacterium]
MNGEKPEKKKKSLGWFIFLLLLLIFALSSGIVIKRYYPRCEAEWKYKSMQKEVDEKRKENKKDQSKDSVSDDSVRANVDFKALKAQYPDVIGWLNVPGTEIDYPILMSSKDKDTDYYLRRTIDEKESLPGCIYVEKEQNRDFSDFNTIIYGHNMRNGTMFGTLKRFRDEQFFEEHPEFTVETEDRLMTYKIYVSVRMDDRHLLKSYDQSTESGKEQYLKDIGSGSDSYFHHSDLKPTENDHLITLSTCIGQDPSHRFLLVGVLKKTQTIQQ